MNLSRYLPVILGLGLLAPVSAIAAGFHLQNHLISADFDDTGLTRITASETGAVLDFADDSASLKIDGENLAAPGLKLTDGR